MPLIRLITFLGLAVSLTQAFPLLEGEDNMIKQVVTLITRPDIAIQNEPELAPLVGHMGLHPRVFDSQLHEAAQVAFISLRDMGDKHSPLILQSLAAYHDTRDSARMAIYRNSIYSRLVDLAKDNPGSWKEHMETAQTQLHLKLHQTLVKINAAQLPPLGKPEDIKRIQKFAADFAQKNQKQLEEYAQQLLKKVPTYNTEMKYLSKEQVNKDLTRTSANSPESVTLIIDPHQHNRISAPSAQPVSPAVAPHSAQLVAASA